MKVAEVLPSTRAVVTEIPALAPLLEPDPDPWAKRRSRPLVAIALTAALVGFGFYAWTRRQVPAAALDPVSVTTPREPTTTVARAIETATEIAPSAGDLPAAVPASAAVSATKVSLPAKAARAVTAVVTTSEIVPEAEPARTGDRGRAMHDAVGADGSMRVAKTEASRGDGARTVRPSPGAVIGALNAVLPAARECLGPDDSIRVGTVTFRSDGTVERVELTQKRASDDCVKSAISTAHVEPFADERFSTRITVRP